MRVLGARKGKGEGEIGLGHQYAHAKYVWPARLELFCVSVQRNGFAAAIAVCTRTLPCWKIVPKCTRIDLRASKIQKFPGGACPKTPLATVPFGRTSPGLLSAILDPPLSRTTCKLLPPPLPSARSLLLVIGHSISIHFCTKHMAPLAKM